VVASFTETDIMRSIRRILNAAATSFIIAAFSLFKRNMNAQNCTNSSLPEKFQLYRKAATVRFAWIEVPALLFLVYALLTADAKYLVYAGVIPTVLIFTSRSLSGAGKQLRTSEDQLL